MADNLTNQILKDLREKQQNLQQTSSPTLQQTNQIGQSLFDQLSSGLDLETIPSEKKSGALQGVGSLMWNALDSALLGIPGIAAEKKYGEKPYDVMSGKTEGLATFGAIVGQGIGFLAPMKVIGTGVRGVVSAVSKKGTSKLVSKAAEASGITAKTEFGLGKEIVEKSVRRGLKDSSLKGPRGPLSKYELSLDEINKIENQVKSSVYSSLKKDFPEALDENLLRISSEATDLLKSKGVHVNNLTDVIGSSLNTKLGTDTANKITRYFARAADQAVTFGIYNLLQDGVYSVSTEKEFDPVSDISDAALFSLFLPAVDMIGGGGKVHIMREAKKLRDSLKKIKNRNYDDLTKEQANGLLTILSRDNYLKDTIIGQTAHKYSFQQMEKEKAVKYIKEIMDVVDPNTIYKSFYKEAKEDFVASLGRMLVGGAYFDVHTLMNTDLIKAMSGEELAAHFLTGAFFSKIKRPLFQEKYRYINSEFQDRARALEYLGLDASSLEHYSRAFNSDVHFAAAYSGILADPVVKKIENIFEKQPHRNQQEGDDFKGVEPLRNIPQSRLALFAHDIYAMAALQKNITDPKTGDSLIRLENLTPEQIQNISSELSKLEISKGEKLSIENFEGWKNDLMDRSLSRVGELHTDTLRDIAKQIGLQHDIDYVFNMDKPMKMARLLDTKENVTDENYVELKKFIQLRNKLEDAGFIETINQRPSEMLNIREVINDADNKRQINEKIDLMMRTITRENYGEKYDEIVDPIDNTFILSLQRHKHAKKRESLYNIADGNLNRLTEQQIDLYNKLQEQLGDRIPRIREGDRLQIVKGNLTDEAWKNIQIKTDEKGIDYLDNQLNLIAEIWSGGGNRMTGPIKSSKDSKIPYEEAKLIVESLAAQGYKLDRNTVQEQKAWHYSRLLNSPYITPNHISIIDNMMAHNFARFEKRDGKPILIIPDKRTIEAYLVDPNGGRLEVKSSQFKEYLRKYDESMKALDRVTGDYVDVSSELFMKQTENILGSIDEMYRFTSDFNRQIYSEYNELLKSVNGDNKKFDNIIGLIEKLYIVDEDGDGTRTRKVITDKKELIELNELIKDIQKNPPEGLEPSFLNNLTSLRENLNQEFNTQQEVATVKSLAKTIEDRINENFETGYKQNMLLDSILFDAKNYSEDNILLKRRTDSMISRFKTYLENKHDIKIKKDASIGDIIMEANRRGDSGYINEQLISYIEVFRKGYDEETYFEIQASEQERMGDYSTALSKKQEAISPSSITAMYERFNPRLKTDELKLMVEDAKIAETESDSKFKKSLKNIEDEIILAIANKYTNEDKVLDDEAFKVERDSFLQNTYPQLINQIIGRDYIKSLELSQADDRSGILSVSNTTIGKGALSDFARSMRDIELDVFLLKRTATWGNRKTEILDVPELARIIEGSVAISDPQEIIKKGLKKENISDKDLNVPVMDFVKVTVSQNSTLVVPRNQVVDGRLGKKFKNWYDNKVKYLDEKQPEGYEITKKNLKSIYEEFTKNVNSSLAKGNIRQMVRAMYFDSISSKLFNDIVNAAGSKSKREGLASSFFKYVSLGEATGAKSQANEKFLKIIKDREFISQDQKQAIESYLQDKKLNVVSIEDEIDVKNNPLTASNMYNNILNKMDGYESGLVKENKKAIETLFKSLKSSSMNAQSYLSTKAASLLYLHKGRDATSEKNKFGTAGVKPTVWFNQNNESILMKTNFVYDPKIAEVLDKSDIDILTTESAAKAFNREQLSVTKDEFNAMESKNDVDIVGVIANKKGPRNVAEIQLENIFLGKVEDRKNLTNVTYAMSDFLNESGYKSFRDEFVDYERKLEKHLGTLKDLADGDRRQASAQFLLNKMRSENNMFEDSQDGLAATLIESGIDPNSIFINETLKRMSTKSLINNLRSPKTKGASYSILVPFLEGSVPLYKDVEDSSKRIQVAMGGKKLSYDDGNIIMDDVDKIQYILTVNMPTKDSKSPIKRDVQLGRDYEGKWTIQDPYKSLSQKELKNEIKKIEEIEEKTENGRTMSRVHDELLSLSKNSDTKFYLHSLSLRMPNLGGDVAVHKVEGFFDPEQGNVVGVNVYDIAQTHQADFDVDALFSYHTKPTNLSNDIWNDSGMSVDAYIYPSTELSMDFFGMGDDPSTAGSQYSFEDNLDKHMKLYQQSKKNFGVAKKLSTELSFFLRNPNLISLENMGVTNVSKSDKLNYSEFLQTYKNTLQSIIDAAKKPNWASRAKQNEIRDYILFGDKPDGYALDDIESNFGQQNFKGFFTIETKDLPERRIIKDAIIEIFRVKSKSQRVLTDVFDAAGRRPPDANEIGMVRSELDSFYNNPNKFLYDRLRNDRIRRGRRDEITFLNNFFFGNNLNSIKDWNDLLKINPAMNPTQSKIFIDRTNIDKIKNGTISSFVVSKLNQKVLNFESSSNIAGGKGLSARKAVENIMDRIDVFTALSGDLTYDNFVKNMDDDGGVVSGTFLSGYVKSLSRDKEIDEKQVRVYSLLYAALDKQKLSLQRFINKAGKNQTDSLLRAKSKLRNTDYLIEYLNQKESDFIGKINGNKSLTEAYNLSIKTVPQGKKQIIKNKSSKNPIYVYKKRETDGKIFFEQSRWIAPNKSDSFYGGEYYILNNPIKYQDLTKKELIDAYSLLMVTGDIQVQHLGLEPDRENKFLFQYQQLSKTLGGLASITYKDNVNNPYGKENWSLERLQEDALVKDFIDEFSNKEDTKESRQDLDNVNTSLQDLVKFMIKPEVAFGTFATGKGGIRLPAFKINKRMGNAVFRYLKNNRHDDILSEIVNQYGSEFRRRFDGIMPEQEAKLYRSDLDSRDESFFRTYTDPNMEYAATSRILFDNAAMFNHWQHSLSRIGDDSKTFRDVDGRYDLIFKYGTKEQLFSDNKLYRDSFEQFIRDKEQVECY